MCILLRFSLCRRKVVFYKCNAMTNFLFLYKFKVDIIIATSTTLGFGADVLL